MACMYKVGDVVQVRSDLMDYTGYKMLSGSIKGYTVSSGTLISSYKGRALHIASVSVYETHYSIKEGPGSFSDEMLVPAKSIYCTSLL